MTKNGNIEPLLNIKHLSPALTGSDFRDACVGNSNERSIVSRGQSCYDEGASSMATMNIQEATRSYEAWLAGYIRVIKSDVEAKHELMARDPFSFFRATFYRWMQLYPEVCPKAWGAPRVLAVGDLHVENYGTWRDAEGRLVWGINDFDEVSSLPYTVDLVRLAASAALAIKLNHLRFTAARACAAILEGYSDSLATSGEPLVLSEKHAWLRKAVTGRERDPVVFWQKFEALPTVTQVPARVMKLLKDAMPGKNLEFRVAHRRAGLGSLGRERFTAIAQWNGSNIAREAKALLPSASVWANGARDSGIYYGQMLRQIVRSADPFMTMRDGWILRRLAPYCNRIELQQLPRGPYVEKLLRVMGRELANVHLGTRGAAAPVRADLRKRGPKWLQHASAAMVEATLKDWNEWRKDWNRNK